MKSFSRYRNHLQRDGERTIRKSVSCEPLLDISSSDEEDRTGGKDSSNGVYQSFSSSSFFFFLIIITPLVLSTRHGPRCVHGSNLPLKHGALTLLQVLV